MSIPPDIKIVDPGIGFPHQSIEEKVATYDFFRPLLKDRQSREDFEFPAQYMFKDVPDIVDPGEDPVAWTVAQMDAFNIDIAITGATEKGIRAKQEHPGRFYLSGRVDPNDGMESLRRMEQLKADHDIVSVSCFPSGTFPQVAVNDKKMYPIYAKCVDLGIPICINGGIVGPRMPSWPQYVEHFDEVLYDFPELTMVMMHGAEPWTALAAKLMLKWPGLHYMTSAFAPKHYPKDIIDFANSRGADKVFYCGYFPAGLSLERQFSDMPDVPFKDHVWPKFLRENALRVFGIPT
ncbi:amidohydrolase family protein [Acidimicrobiia bacterium EGI L10123]|uniref:amidohydrolase family protein n=1 Tax=Salinilacustrithrix flava TaxID=2957203 RepID=UPI003D7C2B14|nr:amidohydrolase family protein [Acidimicrobiia bacterium EGI L10123]